MSGKHNLAEIFPVHSEGSEPVDKDGEDNDNGLTDIHIEVALNGYHITFTYEDGSEEKYIQDDFDDVLKLIRSKH